MRITQIDHFRAGQSTQRKQQTPLKTDEHFGSSVTLDVVVERKDLLMVSQRKYKIQVVDVDKPCNQLQSSVKQASIVSKQHPIGRSYKRRHSATTSVDQQSIY